MSNSRKVVWVSFALFMFAQLGAIYFVDKNQEDMFFLMKIKGFIPYMLYFSLVGVVLFLFSFMVYQLDGIKAKKQIAKLENDKNELKAKLFDLQEELSNSSESKAVPRIESKPDPSPKVEEEPSKSEEKSE